MVTEQEKQEAENKKNILMLKQLDKLEPFQIWRDWVVSPVIAQLEAELANADKLDEVVLRANLKHLASVKYLFQDVFKQL